jgi:hypothetical protein
MNAKTPSRFGLGSALVVVAQARVAIGSRGLQKFANAPDVIADPGSQGERHAQRLVHVVG